MQSPKNLAYHIADAPNLVSLSNAAIGFLASVAALSGHIASALILVQLSVFLDHLDGHLARRAKGSDPNRRAFGGELDSLSDLLNFGMVPALLCYLLLDQSVLGIISGLVILLAGVSRLAYFNIYGMEGGAFYGMPTTYAAFFFSIIAFGLMAAELSLTIFLPIATVILAIAEVSKFRFPKFSTPISLVFAVNAGMALLIWWFLEGGMS